MELLDASRHTYISPTCRIHLSFVRLFPTEQQSSFLDRIAAIYIVAQLISKAGWGWGRKVRLDCAKGMSASGQRARNSDRSDVLLGILPLTIRRGCLRLLRM